MNDKVRKIIKEIVEETLKENMVDDALEKLKDVGSFSNLPSIYKLSLMQSSGDIDGIRKLDLRKIYSELGGTFGKNKLKVRVKSIANQPIDHRFSKLQRNKEGVMTKYVHESGPKSYVRIVFEDGKSLPIMLDNLELIGYNEE